MPATWTQMAKTALDAARAWRTMPREPGTSDRDLRFSAVDVVVLSLLLSLEGLDTLVCADDRLRARLMTVWAVEPATAQRRAVASSTGGRTLVLTPVTGIAGAGVTPATRVAYGLFGGVALSDLPADRADIHLRPLSSAGPALWQSGLALVTGAGEAAAADDLIARLGAAMRGEWIDPLALYERVQDLTGKLTALGHAEAADPEARLDRIAELEHEIASLKRSALVSQHLALVDAAERAGTPR